MSEHSDILSITQHRPWPLPDYPWFMYQEWHDLLFAHWSFPAELIRPLVPTELELDLFDGKAWIGLTPFKMRNVHFRGVPQIPGTADFLEMNLRTYVRAPKHIPSTSVEHKAPGHDPSDREMKPGIFFFSLDASNIAAVLGARIGLGLPYYWSEMDALDHEDGTVDYRSKRRQGTDHAEFVARYKPEGPVLTEKSELEIFITERYCLYEVRAGVAFRSEIQHKEWPLQRATASIEKNSVGSAHGIDLSAQPAHLHFSKELQVIVFPPAPVE